MQSIARFFEAGGPMMLPILGVGLVGFAIGIERFVTLSRGRAHSRRMWAQLEPVLQQGDFDKAREMVGRDDSAIGRLLGTRPCHAGRRAPPRRRREGDAGRHDGNCAAHGKAHALPRHLREPRDAAGLLGTVSGLIKAFSAVATANPAEKANLLSASISEAMNCTAFGLGVAVPLLFLHAFLGARSQQMVESLETAAIKYLNVLTLRTNRVAAQATVQNIRAA